MSYFIDICFIINSPNSNIEIEIKNYLLSDAIYILNSCSFFFSAYVRGILMVADILYMYIYIYIYIYIYKCVCVCVC